MEMTVYRARLQRYRLAAMLVFSIVVFIASRT